MNEIELLSEENGIIEIPDELIERVRSLPRGKRPRHVLANGLTIQQTAFCNHYSTILNGTEAARRSGYSGDERTWATQSSRLLSKGKIRAYLDVLYRRASMTPGEVQARVSEAARGDLGKLAGVVEVAEKTGSAAEALRHASKLGVAHLIKRLRMTRDGVDLQIHDSLSALRFSAELNGMLSQKVVLSHEQADQELAELLGVIAAAREDDVVDAEVIEEEPQS